jgi:hypothetical protein
VSVRLHSILLSPSEVSPFRSEVTCFPYRDQTSRTPLTSNKYIFPKTILGLFYRCSEMPQDILKINRIILGQYMILIGPIPDALGQSAHLPKTSQDHLKINKSILGQYVILIGLAQDQHQISWDIIYITKSVPGHSTHISKSPWDSFVEA